MRSAESVFRGQQQVRGAGSGRCLIMDTVADLVMSVAHELERSDDCPRRAQCRRYRLSCGLRC